MATLLIVHHSPSRTMRQLTEAIAEGARNDEIEDVDVVVRPALEATAQDVLDADGYVLSTAAHFGYMSGGLKYFFDNVFLDIGGSLAPDGSSQESAGATAKRPYGLLVHGRYDTTGAVRSVQSIVGALGWTQAWNVVEILGDLDDPGLARAAELGATIAAQLAQAET